MIEITARDENALPLALLAPAKEYLRVKFCDDDPLIAGLLGAALGQFERTRGVTLFPTTYRWVVGDAAFVNDMVKITPDQPITPISAWTAQTVVDAITTPVTADYSLAQSGLHGAVFYSLVGAAQTGLELAITSGYATPAEIPQSIQHLIFTICATYYEYREKLTPSNLNLHPTWDQAEMAGFWVPRA